MTKGLLLLSLSLAILVIPLGCRRFTMGEAPEEGQPAIHGQANPPDGTAAGQTTPAEAPAPTLPADYPKDVPIWPKAKVTSSTAVGKKTAVRFETDASVFEVASFYNAALPRDDWEILATTNSKSGSVIGATKGGRILDVIVAQGKQATLITLGLSQP
jgi:hypothetical protein